MARHVASDQNVGDPRPDSVVAFRCNRMARKQLNMEKKSKYLTTPTVTSSTSSSASTATMLPNEISLLDASLPPPPEDPVTELYDDRRLWIGNVDTRITEFTLLKLLQKFGHLEKFDFLYHKSGPDQGKPRGYCFATFDTLKEAEAAKKGLNGKLALTKKLIVRNAHKERKILTEEKSTPSPPVDRGSQIRAIEAKLHMMEKGVEASTTPVPPSAHLHHASSSNRFDSSRDSNSYRGQQRRTTHTASGSSLVNRTKPYSNSRGRTNR